MRKLDWEDILRRGYNFRRGRRSHRLKIIPRDILVLEEARERLEEMGIRAVT
jgi:hypothetical protein